MNCAVRCAGLTGPGRATGFALALTVGSLSMLVDPAIAESSAVDLDEVYEQLAIDSVPAHYVVLVDTSGSMQADDLYDEVRDSLTEFVAALSPDDRVALVSVAEEADQIWDGEVGNAPDEVVRRLPDRPTGAYTDLGAGIAAAVDSLETQADTPIAGVVLLTDGQHEPPPGSAFPLTEGYAWQQLTERAGELAQEVSPFAVQLRGANGARLLRTVFLDAQVLDSGSVDDLTTLLAEPKAAVRADKARSLLAEDLTAGIAVDWPGGATGLSHGANRLTLTLRSTTHHLPVELTDLTIRSDSPAVRVEAPTGPIAVPAGGSLELPVTVHWDAGPASWQPFRTVIGEYRLELSGTVGSPWSGVLAEELQLDVAPDLTGTETTGRGSANRGSLGRWLAGLAGLAVLLAVGMRLRWMRLNPVPGGVLVATPAGAGRREGTMPLQRRRSRISAGSLGIAGSGTVAGRRRRLRSEVHVSVTYSPDGTVERRRSEEVPMRGAVEVDDVRFEWRP
jgi:hypothetical protein